MCFFFMSYSIRKGGVCLIKQKVSLRLEELLLLLMEKYDTDNKSEAIRLALIENVSEGDSKQDVV